MPNRIGGAIASVRDAAQLVRRNRPCERINDGSEFGGTMPAGGQLNVADGVCDHGADWWRRAVALAVHKQPPPTSTSDEVRAVTTP